MIIIWLFLILELFIFFIIKPITFNSDFWAVIIVLLHLPILLSVLLKILERKVFIYIFLGVFLRLFFVYVDIYFIDVFQLPHSGGDSVGFYRTSVEVSKDLSLLTENIYGGLFTKMMGIVLFLGPESRVVLQYLNILFITFTITLSYKIMSQLNVKTKIKRAMVLFMVVFPSSIIFSSVFLREAVIAYLVILSIYFFLKWIKNGNKLSVILSLVLIILAATFHSGVISVVVGYVFMMLFYNPDTRKFQSSIQTIFVFSVLVLSVIVINSSSIEEIPFLYKFKVLEESDNAVYDLASGGRGGSAYLQNLEINNPIQMLLFAPIKMLYFLISPVPFDWRGISDVISFFSDGLVYGILFIYPLLNYRKMIKGDPLTIALFIILLSSIFIFGISLNNSGTAMRHRHKIYYLLVIIFSLGLNKLEKEKTRCGKNIKEK